MIVQLLIKNQIALYKKWQAKNKISKSKKT